MKKVIVFLVIVMVMSGCSAGGYTIIKDNELKNLKDQADKLNFEREKWQKEEEAKKTKEQKEESVKLTNQIDRDACINNADSMYTDAWKNSCEVWKSDVDIAWKRCRQNKFLYQDDADNKQFCINTAPDYKEDSNGMCLLPKIKSTVIEEHQKDMKNECYLKYPLN